MPVVTLEKLHLVNNWKSKLCGRVKDGVHVDAGAFLPAPMGCHAKITSPSLCTNTLLGDVFHSSVWKST